MALFGKKKKSTGLPVDEVMQLRKQGVVDSQIVSQMQAKGFTTQQVFDALSQADLKGAAPQGMNPVPPAPPIPMQPVAPPVPMQSSPPQEEVIQEVVETVVNEKWDEFLVEVQKIVDWKDQVTAQIQKLELEVKHLRDGFKDLNSGVLGKVSEYDQRMTDVGAQLSAVQKVFKDVLPEFTENVAKLSRMTGTGVKSITKKGFEEVPIMGVKKKSKKKAL